MKPIAMEKLGFSLEEVNLHTVRSVFEKSWELSDEVKKDAINEYRPVRKGAINEYKGVRGLYGRPRRRRRLDI